MTIFLNAIALATDAVSILGPGTPVAVAVTNLTRFIQTIAAGEALEDALANWSERREAGRALVVA